MGVRLKPLFQKRLTETVNVSISDIPQVGKNGWAEGEQSVTSYLSPQDWNGLFTGFKSK